MLGDVFDPHQQLYVAEQCRPHWSQAGAIVFVTFRTDDSIPRKVLERWQTEQQEWLKRHGIDSNLHWSVAAESINPADRKLFKKYFNEKRESYLDRCQGACVLRDPSLATIVSDSLLHFDEQRYRMGDFVVMPNHVHLLCAFGSAEQMTAQFDSWLHYTATLINRQLGRKGKFWQGEPFDHLVRSPEQYEYLRDYIRDNPKKANLGENGFLYRRYPDS